MPDEAAMKDIAPIWKTMARVCEDSVDVAIWLRAALSCKEWAWDVDQRESAEACLKALDAALSNLDQEARKHG
jgi:hypothetical protein